MKTFVKYSAVLAALCLLFISQTVSAQTCPHPSGTFAFTDDYTSVTPGNFYASPYQQNWFELKTVSGGDFEGYAFGSAGATEPGLAPWDKTKVTFPNLSGTFDVTGALWFYLGQANTQEVNIYIWRRDKSGNVYSDTTWSGNYFSGVQFPRLYELQVPDPSDPMFTTTDYDDYVESLDPVAYVYIDFPGNESGFLKTCVWTARP